MSIVSAGLSLCFYDEPIYFTFARQSEHGSLCARCQLRFLNYSPPFVVLYANTISRSSVIAGKSLVLCRTDCVSFLQLYYLSPIYFLSSARNDSGKFTAVYWPRSVAGELTSDSDGVSVESLS